MASVGFLLISVGGTIMLIALFTGIFFIMYLFAHAHLLFPFRSGYQEGEAEIVRFSVSNTNNDSSLTEPDRQPVFRYYNTYQQKTVEQEILNSGILSPDDRLLFPKERQRAAEVGTMVAVQYTPKAVRVVDERFVSPHKKYSLMRYVAPIIICLVCGIFGAMMLMIGIMLR